MRVLVTGHKGYIGAHLVEVLKGAGHHVVGVDLGLFEGCEWGPVSAADVEMTKDVRRLTAADLEGVDAVIHLAAISNDAMGELDPKITYSVNLEGSVRLAALAKRAGVARFLFSGSCSIYGAAKQLNVFETDPLNPVSAYATSKVESETAIGQLADKSFSPVFLRNATAYGYSPMLRIDLVANNLLASAVALGEIRVTSDGTPWRPLIHCRDIARAFVAFLEAPRELVHNQAVNIGATDQNFQIREVIEVVQRQAPDAAVVYTGEVGADIRNYRVDFSLLGQLLPGFKLEYTLQRGIEELCRDFRAKGFGLDDLCGDRFVRLRRLKPQLHKLGYQAVG